MNNSLTYVKQVLVLLDESKMKLPFIISMFVFVSILDMISIGIIAPFVAILISPNIFLESETYQFLTTYLTFLNSDNLVEVFSYVILVVFSVKTMGAIYINKLILKFSFLYGVDLRKKLMFYYQNQAYSDFLKGNSSRYINRLQIAGEFSQNILQSYLRLISESVVILFILFILFWTSWESLSLLVVLLGGFLALYSYFFKEKIQAYGVSVNESLVKMVKVINENFEGFKLIRIFGKNQFFYKQLEKSAEIYASVNIKNQMLVTSPRYLLELLIVIFIVLLVLWLNFFSITSNEAVSIISMFSIAAIRLIPSANTLINSINSIRYGRHITDILYHDFIKLEGRFATRLDQRPKESEFNSLELKNIQFSHENSNFDILNNASLKINAGDAVGIIGKSGSGKTTLIDIILGLLNPKQGEVIVNNSPLQDNIANFWSHVAYLPQQAVIIDDSLRKNVAFGQSEREIDDVKVVQALQSAQLSEFLDQLPNGVDSILGERGMLLSGGQRQRVSLARAFYYEKNILIMDESTSALDDATEREIVQEVQKLKGSNTIIVIAHRLSTLEYCDYIYEIKNGEINQI